MFTFLFVSPFSFDLLTSFVRTKGPARVTPDRLAIKHEPCATEIKESAKNGFAAKH